ncbi:DUF6384 family protein [Arenicella xantha]|uniref:Uncharacterized protein n=1 Tax=Arenicella xantha TaxID=644221 RepID=A0A395JKC9_9GAMM|nr:DUF6384 family protein [Arenicella xantha]RBP49238.1 hypothetical protein DFR28_104166 [Arenicella xantha]
MPESAPQSAALEDIMVAMDVVDTLRHQEKLVARELDGEGRRERLLTRLRNMYAAQGIEVPDHVLEQGIAALEEERFQYKAVASSWRTRIAKIWVSRARWAKPVGFLSVLASALYAVYFTVDVLPQRQLLSSLPTQVRTSLSQIKAVAKKPEIVVEAERIAANAQAALAAGNLEVAESVLGNLTALNRQLNQSFTVRIVARPNKQSGVWRRPPGNPNGRNYYLIVEAVDAKNQPVELAIMNEENNKATKVTSWGLRVDEKTFNRVAADKKDDGIIQNNIVGHKPVGVLQMEYVVATSGATITEW